MDTKLKLNINSNTNKYENIVESITELDLEIQIYQQKINEENLLELENRKKNIILKHQNLDSYISNIHHKFEDLYLILDHKITDLRELESKRKKKINNNVKNVKERDIESKNNYLLKLHSNIEDTENKKNKSLNSLNQVNLLLDEKMKQLEELEKQRKAEEIRISRYQKIKLENNNKKGANRVNSIAVMVHFFNINLYDEIYSYLCRLKSENVTFDLYVNLAINSQSDLKKS